MRERLLLVNQENLFFNIKRQTTKVCLLLLVLGLSGCSLWRSDKTKDSFDDIEIAPLQNKDYLAVYEALDKAYKDTLARDYKYLSGGSQFYLKKIVRSIANSNELFFDKKINIDFKVVKDKRPFHFSIPPNKIFFSSGLLLKYIESESFLTVIISYELARLEKKFYKKITPIPVGFIATEKLLSYLRLDSDEKLLVHQWGYHNLYRSIYYSDAYLSWIQVQNRKSLDFILHLGEQGAISREESLFKGFLVKYNLTSVSNKKSFEGSPREFYSFISEVERKTYEN